MRRGKVSSLVVKGNVAMEWLLLGRGVSTWQLMS